MVAAMAAGAPSPPLPVSPMHRKSFASIASTTTMQTAIPLIPPTLFKGEPALRLSHEIINTLAQPFKFVLIGKFSHGRPSMEATKKFFHTFDLVSPVSLGYLDSKHILIQVNHEAWMKDQSFFGNFPMRVFKWRPPDVESPIVPVASLSIFFTNKPFSLLQT